MRNVSAVMPGLAWRHRCAIADQGKGDGEGRGGEEEEGAGF